MLDIPDNVKSFWREAYQERLYPELNDEFELDVAIVGGGITGLTAAYLLKKSGMQVAVLEKDTIGGGTTGRTTGKVTSQHNILYNDLAKRLGEETAQIYGEANEAALRLIDDIITSERFSCGWKREDNYVYTTEPKQIEKFKTESVVAEKLELPASFVTDTPLPFDVLGAVRFKNQAKIHSQEYVNNLAKVVDGEGSFVFEESNVIGIRDGSPGRVNTKSGKIKAKHIIVATNVPTMPLMARGAYCILEYPTESYIVAGKLDQEIRGMYISPDLYNYSILPVDFGKERMLLVGGEGHISGLRGNTKGRFRNLANYAERNFGIKNIGYKWSDRDYLTYDGIPLAGPVYPWSKNLYVASAFRKWGLTNGTASAMIIHDLIVGKKNKWADAYNPNRIKPILSIPRVAAKYILGQN